MLQKVRSALRGILKKTKTAAERGRQNDEMVEYKRKMAYEKTRIPLYITWNI